MEYYYGGIEAGGTKIVCALANSPDDVLAIEEFPTSTPQETIPRIIKFFKTTTFAVPVGINMRRPSLPSPPVFV